MDYGSVEQFHNGILLKRVINFGLGETLNNGSSFRWVNQGGNRYLGIVQNKVMQLGYVSPHSLYIDNITIDEFNNYFKYYFDLETDYNEIYKELLKDGVLKELIPSNGGLRLIKQDFLESFISAFISQNNNINRIKNSVAMLCRRHGNELKYKGEIFYGFPNLKTLEKLSIKDWENIGLGYRAENIYNAIKTLINVQDRYGDLETHYMGMQYGRLVEELKYFKGIGDKVANFIITMTGRCAGFMDSFVVDVWIKRAVEDLYDLQCSPRNIEFLRKEKFKGFTAIAQQNIFYYYRRK